MMLSRTDVLDDLRKTVQAGEPIIAAGAGSGIAAKWARAGGADLIFVYNSARCRMQGRSPLYGMLPITDANAVTLDLAIDVVPLLPDTPIIGGVNATDPYRHMPRFIEEVRDAGLVGVMNWPTIGMFDGAFRKQLESAGISLEQEIEMIRHANKRDLLTAPYGYDDKTTRQMVRAGADIIITFLGVTASEIDTQGNSGLDEAVTQVQQVADAANDVDDDVFVLAHGGPISSPVDVEYVLNNADKVDGFIGGSAIERVPTEKAIKKRVEQFKGIHLA